MSQPEGKEPFLQDVFPAELEEINKRRQELHLPHVPSDCAPSTKLGLVGLALSGGGIRSATFHLGVIQALAKHGLLKTVDYLSTVSGGGYIGSCLSSLLNDQEVGPDQERFPLQYKMGTKEPLRRRPTASECSLLGAGWLVGPSSHPCAYVARRAQQPVHFPVSRLAVRIRDGVRL